jgi:hypothetical protein
MQGGSFTLSSPPTGSEKPAAAAAATTPAAVDTNARPSWLPEKFKTPEQMAEAYSHLEAKLGQPKSEDKKAPDQAPANAEAAKPEDKKADDTAKPEDKKAEDAVVQDLTHKGIDVKAMSERFWEKGELNADDKTTLVDALKEKFGDDAETLVNDFATAQKEAYEYRQEKVHAPMGGKDKSAAMIEWAKSTLSEPQKQAINTLWSSNDVAQQIEGSKMVAQLYAAANGSKPAVVVSGDAPATTSAGYQSQAEMTADMNDKRYKTDPAFQQAVIRKLAATTAF